MTHRDADQTALLIGTTAGVRQLRCQMLVNELEGSPMPWPCGCVLLDDPGRSDPGVPVLGGLEDLDDLLGWHRFDVALITAPAGRGAESEAIRHRLEALGVTTRVVPMLEDVLAGRSEGASSSVRVPQGRLDVAALIGRDPFPVDEREVGALLRGRRVLVTGAGGSIGSEIAMIAARYGPERLVLMERAENALFEIDRRLREAHPSLQRAGLLHDVVDADGTLAHLREHRPDVIFHAAAHKHVPLMEDHPAHAVTNNLFGTKSIADAAVACGCDRFVMISSDKAVNPTSVMGATKRLAERYIQGLQARTQRTRFSMVRFGNVLASASSVLPIWASQLADGRPLTVTDERMTRYFMTIPEAAGLVIQSAAIEHDGGSARVFVLDMGRPVRILDLAERFCRASGFEPVRLVPGQQPPPDPGVAGIVITGARPGEKLYEELAYSAERLTPTNRPGINAWASDGAGEVDVDALVEDLSRVRASRDRAAVLAAIRRHVPEMRSPVSTGPNETPAGESSIHSGAAA